MDSSDINQLILIEGRERNAGWTGLSFLAGGSTLGGFLFFEMSFQEFGILECPLGVRAQCLSNSGKEETCGIMGNLHLCVQSTGSRYALEKTR